MKIEIKKIDGYAYGAIQPSFILIFRDVSVTYKNVIEKLENLLELFPEFYDGNRFFDSGVAVEPASPLALFVTILDTLNHYCGDQRFTPIRVLQEENSLCFALPTLSTEMCSFNINLIKSLLEMTDKADLREQAVGFLENHKRKARVFLPAGTNAGSFIAAAAERKIPFKIFNQQYIIFGYGIGSRIFNSSVTDEESAIGVRLAKSKVDTNRLLKMSGFPVAEQARVRTVDDAIRFAENIGYPVVLKPEAEEQGRGVFANIMDDSELKECFRKASSDFKNLIIEKFVKGLTYRVHLHHGKVMDAWKTNPPSIIGDGHSSIRELIDLENAKPERNAINSPIKPIPKDYTTALNLQKLGLDFDFSPSLGEEIVLAVTSNESRGGSSQNFLSFLHPEIANLCIQAARTLRLQVAAIDLISEDAAVSLRESDTFICEVNSQPQLGDLETYPHLFHDLLDKLPDSCPEVIVVVSKKSENYFFNAFNKSVENISVRVPPHYLLKHGSPTQYFNKIEFEDDISLEEQQKIVAMLTSTLPDR